MTNLWHDISYGEDAPSVITAAIEISRGSRAKYEIDKDTGLLMLDRVLHSAVFYPANYGFVPRTLGEDNDPLDVLVLSQVDIQPLCLVEARVVGVMHMVDGGEGDDKIIAVAKADPAMRHIHDINDIPEALRAEIQTFFEQYKHLEKKQVSVTGYSNKAKAESIIKQSITAYDAKFVLVD